MWSERWGVVRAMLRGVPANAMLFFVYEQVIAAWPLDRATLIVTDSEQRR